MERAKTAKERMALYRMRIKSNPNEYKHHLEKERLRKADHMLSLTEAERQEHNHNHKSATQRWRDKKEQGDGQQNTPGKGYATPAALSKAYSRVRKVLPKSPSKQTMIIHRLSTVLKPITTTFTRPHNRSVPENNVLIVKQFYENDATSTVSPGKADFIRVKTQTGDIQRLQRRYMIMTVLEAFALFCKEYPHIEIGKSKFAEFRPPNVLLVSQVPVNVCGCKYHNNIILLMESLHRRIPAIIPLYSRHELCLLCVCDGDSRECMQDVCSECQGKFKAVIESISEEEKSMSMKWLQWAEDEDGYIMKQEQTGTVGEALHSLSSQLPRFLWHNFIKDKQSKLYELEKHQADHEQSQTCVLQIDFSENFTVSYQDEISSAHWKKRQISLFTSQWNHRGKIQNLICASDCLQHEKTTVTAYLFHIVSSIYESLPTVKQVHIWSDGPSSQFKNKYMFSLLTVLYSHKYDIVWNYFATSHGKGPTDALGGNAKRIVHRKSMGKQAHVKDANSFAQALVNTNINIKVFTVDEINKTCNDLGVKHIWDNVAPIPGTINFHHVSVIDSKTICCKFYGDAEDARNVTLHVNTRVSQTQRQCQSSTPQRADDAGQVTCQDWPCSLCKVKYGDPNDPKKNEEWLRCDKCHGWFHQSCAEWSGLLDDDDTFVCGTWGKFLSRV